ncbi:MAG: YaaA family protein [Spirochaetaceae bacterium]|nr:YaaA family protein [Spirochaetaceae bacterium]
MIIMILLSPTKQMDFSGTFPDIYRIETPPFQKEAIMLNNLLMGYNPEELSSLMGISKILADQSHMSIQRFTSAETRPKPAIFTYSGTVFKALNPESLSRSQLRFAQDQLRILSGMYGILCPSTGIAPYRLEMKTPLKLPGNKSLTSFWKPRVTEYLKNEAVILNLASHEYSRVIDKQALKGKLITFHFKEQNKDKIRTVGMYAKNARGLMLRWILMEKIVDLRVLQEYEIGGYRYNHSLSTDSDWVFIR